MACGHLWVISTCWLKREKIQAMSSPQRHHSNAFRKSNPVALHPVYPIRHAAPDVIPGQEIWKDFLTSTRILDILRPDYYLVFRFHDACRILHQENISLNLGGQTVHYESLMNSLQEIDCRFIRSADQHVIQLIRERKLQPFDVTYRIGANVTCANPNVRRLLRTCVLIQTGSEVMTGLMCFHNVTRSVAALRHHGVELSCRPGLEYLQQEIDDRLAACLPATSMPTPRELEILLCLRQGMSSKQIADALFIAKNTVDTHRQNMLRKWHLPNTAALLHMAMSAGWGGPNHDKSA
jgi:DNA-binding CsgD family transcriptional regulator